MGAAADVPALVDLPCGSRCFEVSATRSVCGTGGDRCAARASRWTRGTAAADDNVSANRRDHRRILCLNIAYGVGSTSVPCRKAFSSRVTTFGDCAAVRVEGTARFLLPIGITLCEVRNQSRFVYQFCFASVENLWRDWRVRNG